jgi:hypothetical protein
VAAKRILFPTDAKIVAAVRAALKAPSRTA